MKKVILLSLALLMVFVVSAVSHVPAQLVLNYFPMSPQLALGGVTGTLWDGQATDVKWQNSDLGAFNWQLSPLKLLLAKVEAQVRFGRGSDMQILGRGTVGLSLSGPYANNLIVSLPIDKVLNFVPPLPIPVELSGNVELSVQSMVYDEPYCQSGNGSLVWNTDKIVTPLAELTLGPVVANFSCQNSEVKIAAEQSSQAISSAGDLVLNPDRTYQTSAWFKPGENFPAAFSEQLNWLPSPDGQGRYQFNYQGRLN